MVGAVGTVYGLRVRNIEAKIDRVTSEICGDLEDPSSCPVGCDSSHGVTQADCDAAAQSAPIANVSFVTAGALALGAIASFIVEEVSRGPAESAEVSLSASVAPATRDLAGAASASPLTELVSKRRAR